MRSLAQLRSGPFRTLSGLATVVVLAATALVVVPAATAAPDLEPVAQPAVERPPWHALPLVDASTGQTFILADFAGKTVYVEPMATWCTNCRQQMSVIRDQVRGQVDPEQVVFVSLSVETNLTPEALAAYATTHGFDWTFAVMSQELLQELAAQYGRTVTNPPAVPHLLISPDGTSSDLSTGFHSAERLLERLSMAGMAHKYIMVEVGR